MLLLIATYGVASLAPPLHPGTPPIAVVERIEKKLAKNRCVGHLARWWRQYAFQVRALKVNKNFVSVHFVEAGHDGKTSGRFITEPIPPGIDDSQHRLVYGEYEIVADRFSEFTCGWNFLPALRKQG